MTKRRKRNIKNFVTSIVFVYIHKCLMVNALRCDNNHNHNNNNYI